MKYISVADATESLENLPLGKVRLTIVGDGSETPWVKVMTDGRQVLQNHAVSFYPFPSWGMVLPKGSEINVDEYREKEEIPLHAHVFKSYLKDGVIDEEGNFIVPETLPKT